MSRSGQRPAFLRPGHRLPAIFVVGILLPGVVLAVFSARALVQERRLADQQIRERLERVAALTIRELGQELGQWQGSVEELAGSGILASNREISSLAAASWPERVRQVVDTPGSGVIIFGDGEDLGVLPPGQLLYPPTASPRSSPAVEPPRGLAEAEFAELRDKDYPRAIQLYEQLSEGAAAGDRALLVHRLARTSKKAGLHDEALRYYRVLEQAGEERVGPLPAGLIAKVELCSLWEEQEAADDLAVGARELYEGLVSGRWSLEKSRYLFYSGKALEWLAQSPDRPGDPLGSQEMERLRETEQKKLALTTAVEEVADRPQRLLHTGERLSLAFWDTEPFVALILSAEFVRSRIWAPVLAAAGDSELELSLLGPGGEVMLGAGPPAELALGVRRDLTEIGLPLSLWVWPSSTSALHADLARRRILYLAMLSLVVALLSFGSYLTVRTVRRELEVARLKSEFVSAVSHEFRSPLTGIQQLGEMLLRGRVKDEARKRAYYRMIVRESSRLSRLVENVLDFSRIEEAREEYEFKPLEPGPWLLQVVEEFRQEIADSGVAIIAEVPGHLPTLHGDGEALSCAVHNLLDNAVKYSAGSDEVRLEAEASDGKLSVRVRDQGVGISDEDQKHIFEKFFRGGGDISQEVKGVGLGLSLAQHIVNAHGGSIDLESKAGEGSTFTVALPARPGPAEDRPAESAER